MSYLNLKFTGKNIKKRLLVVTQIPSPYQVELFDEINYQDKLDLSVIYIRAMTKGRVMTERLRLEHRAVMLERSLKESIPRRCALAQRLLLKCKPDLVVVTQYSDPVYQRIMSIASKKRIPWVFWSEPMGTRYFEVNSSCPDWLRPYMRRAAIWQARHFASEFWAIGKRALEQFSELSDRPCRIVPYSSDLARFNRITRKQSKDSAVRFLYVGRYSHRKGVDLIIRASRKLMQDVTTIRPVKFTFCGYGELQEPLDQLAAEFPMICRQMGFVPEANIASVMARHDVLLAPSRYDGWALVVPEAMAAGLCVISTADTGSAYHMGEHPWLKYAQTGSAESLEAEMRSLVAQQTHLPHLGEQAAGFSKRFDVEHGARLIARLTVELLDRGQHLAGESA